MLWQAIIWKIHSFIGSTTNTLGIKNYYGPTSDNNSKPNGDRQSGGNDYTNKKRTGKNTDPFCLADNAIEILSPKILPQAFH